MYHPFPLPGQGINRYYIFIIKCGRGRTRKPYSTTTDRGMICKSLCTNYSFPDIMTSLFNFVNGISMIIDRPRSYYDHLDSITPVIGSRVYKVDEYIMELHLYHWNQKCMKMSNIQPNNAGLVLWSWGVAFEPYFTHKDLMSDSELLFSW